MNQDSESIFNKLIAHFSVNPAGVASIGGSVELCVSEESAKSFCTFHCGPSFDYEMAQASSPDTSITLSASDLALMYNGDLNAQRAFLEGRIQVSGNASIARVFSLYLLEVCGG